MTKQELFNAVREKYNLSQVDRTFFHKDEMVHIVAQINNRDAEWTDIDTFFEEELYTSGWSPQSTTDSHPTILNLEWLLSLDQETIDTTTGSSLDQLVSTLGFDVSALSKVDINRNENTVTLTFS